jgi:hypothetical protein
MGELFLVLRYTQGNKIMTRKKLVTYTEWKTGTTRALHQRSKELKAVDATLKKYTMMCGNINAIASSDNQYLADVENAFNNWKKSKGTNDAWKDSSRNGNNFFTLLDNQLSGVGDTDKGLGAVDFMAADMLHARLGVLFLFSHLKCDDSMFSVALNGAVDITTNALSYGEVEYDKGKVTEGVKVLGAVGKKAEAAIVARQGKKQNVSSNQLLQSVPAPTDSRLREIWTMIRDKVMEYAKKIIAAIKEKLNSIKEKINTIRKDPGQAVIDNIGPNLRKLVDALTSRFLAAAVPFIGAGLDIAKGIVNTLDAGVTKFKEWLASNEVVLSSGHITVIVKSIKQAMAMSIGSGLFDLVKGGMKLGAEFMTAGAAALMSLIASIIEIVVKTVWKMIEISRLSAFFKESALLFQSRANEDSIHKRPVAFNQWFKGYAMSLPVLSVLALNSGVTGNKMLFLQMFQSDTEVVSQHQFDAGVTYLDELKSWGSGYLEGCGFSFSSVDPMVKELLELAKNQAAPPTNKRQLFDVFKGFLNGG